MTIRRIYTIVVIITLMLSACKSDWKKLSPKEMQDILIDMSLTEAYFQNNYTPDSIRVRGYADICRRHNITMRDWDSSVALYSGKHIETYKIIYQNAMDSVVRVQKELQYRKQIKDSIEFRKNNILAGNIDSINLIEDKQNNNNLDFLIRNFEIVPSMPYSENFSVMLSSSIRNIRSSIDTTRLLLKLQLNFTDSTDTIIYKPILNGGISSIHTNIPKGKLMKRAKGGLITRFPILGLLLDSDKLSFMRLPSSDIQDDKDKDKEEKDNELDDTHDSEIQNEPVVIE